MESKSVPVTREPSPTYTNAATSPFQSRQQTPATPPKLGQRQGGHIIGTLMKTIGGAAVSAIAGAAYRGYKKYQAQKQAIENAKRQYEWNQQQDKVYTPVGRRF